MSHHFTCRMKEIPAATLGFVIASFVPAITMILSAPIVGGDSIVILGLSPFIYFFSTAAIVLFGIPIFLLLRRLQYVYWWSALLVGFAIGALVGVILLPHPVANQINNISRFGLLGSASAFAFWMIWRLGRKNPASEQKAAISVNPTKPSVFVTVVAWIFIGSSCCATLFIFLITVLHRLVITWFPLYQPQKLPEFSLLEKFLDPIQILVIGLVLSMATLIVFAGLLKRRNWARIVFIGMLIVSIASNIGNLVFEQIYLQSFRSETIVIVMRIYSVLTTVAFAVLFGWIIKRLTSEAIRNEFK